MSPQPDLVTGHILVIGGNGGIGRQCIEQALLAGYQVTAIVRTPAKLMLSHPDLTIVAGDVTQPVTILSHLPNKDAIISAIGVSGGFGKDKPTSLYSQGAATVLAQLQKTNARRVFFISASAIEISPVNAWFIRFITKYVIARLLKHMYADLHQMEKTIKTSAVDWTIIRPPQLTDQALTGKYRYAINAFLPNCLKIARADVAHFIIHHIGDPATFKTTIELAY